MMVLKYAVMYIGIYIALVGLSVFILEHPNWLYILVTMFIGELSRMFVNVLTPGLDERLAKKGGERGARTAERIKEYFRRRS